MGLETGEFIDDLVQTNPITATDPVTEGSNHLQLIKKVLQQTFPGYDEAVTVTPAELNVLGDAALKGAANVFTELNTFDAGTMVPNNVAYRMMEFDGITPRFFAFIDPSDIMQFGNLNNDGVHTFKETLSFFRGATESFRGVVRSAGVVPVVVRRRWHSQDVAQQPDRVTSVGFLLGVDELVFVHPFDSFTQKAVAFFRISRSITQYRFSFRSCSNSSRSETVNGVSLSFLSCLAIHFARVVSEIPRSAATRHRARPEARTISTA
jgi:hypothetical protein